MPNLCAYYAHASVVCGMPARPEVVQRMLMQGNANARQRTTSLQAQPATEQKRATEQKPQPNGICAQIKLAIHTLQISSAKELGLLSLVLSR